jgi:excisionase family DNA binding protein
VDKELRPGPQFAPKWYSVAQVAQMLGFGLSKTKMLVATGELRSLKDGKHRRILPEWVRRLDLPLPQRFRRVHVGL